MLDDLGGNVVSVLTLLYQLRIQYHTKIFISFFPSTEAQNTGSGLTTCYEITKDNQGTVDIRMGACVIGLRADDILIFDRITQFVVKNNLYSMQLTILIPLPGSRLRERLLAENRVININDWAKYTCNYINIIPRNVTAGQLQEGFCSIHRRVYSDEACTRRTEYFKEIYNNIAEKKHVKNIHCTTYSDIGSSIKYKSGK